MLNQIEMKMMHSYTLRRRDLFNYHICCWCFGCVFSINRYHLYDDEDDDDDDDDDAQSNKKYSEMLAERMNKEDELTAALQSKQLLIDELQGKLKEMQVRSQHERIHSVCSTWGAI
jgi:hypothetical protein